MNLPEAVPPGSIALDVVIADKSLAIAHAARMLEAVAGVPAQAIEAALQAREALGSTGVGAGVALPHSRLHVLRTTHAVFLRFAAPVPFDSIDDRPVDLLCAVIAPDEPNSEMLEAVGAMARVLRDATKTAGLRSASSAAEARMILLDRGADS